MSESFRPTRFKKANPDGSGLFEEGEQPPEPKPTKGQSALEYVLFGVFGLLIVLAGIALWSTYSAEHKRVPNKVAEGLAANRVNILVIGVGGSQHHGGGKDLADAMLLVSLQPSTHRAAVISIPRDFWTKIGPYGTHRLNQAHAIGNQSGYPGLGPGLLSDVVSTMFDQPIHGFVRIDFAAFEKIIDSLGGVDIYCQRGFYDFLFKDGFRAGWHHLDGKRALAYARYRYIVGFEGDNFARERRQQQVIDAVREKAGRRTPQDIARVIAALSALSEHTETNLTASQMVGLARTFQGIDRRQIRHISLKPFTETFMVTRLSDPGEAVRPRNGDVRLLRLLAQDIFRGGGDIRGANEIDLAAGPATPRTPSPAVQ